MEDKKSFQQYFFEGNTRDFSHGADDKHQKREACVLVHSKTIE